MAVVYFRNRGIVSKNVSQKGLGCFPISREENSSNQKLRCIFERGKQFESEAAKHFERISGIKLAESPFIPHRRDANYEASPDSIFYINKNFIKMSLERAS